MQISASLSCGHEDSTPRRTAMDGPHLTMLCVYGKGATSLLSLSQFYIYTRHLLEGRTEG